MSGDTDRAVEAGLLAFQAAIPGTCDWGGCDNNALLARFDPEKGWLPVCQWHAGDASAADLAPITALPLEDAWKALDLLAGWDDADQESAPRASSRPAAPDSPDQLREALTDPDTLSSLTALLTTPCDCDPIWTGRHLHAPDCRWRFIHDFLDDDEIAAIDRALSVSPRSDNE